MNYFLTNIRYEKVLGNGLVKKVTEHYLVDALSFTEAEKRIIEEMIPFISGEFTVTAVKASGYSEIFLSSEPSSDRYFKVKLMFVTLDEKTGNEKKTPTNMLVQASDIRHAIQRIDEEMKGTMADYWIASIQETSILDVYQCPPIRTCIG